MWRTILFGLLSGCAASADRPADTGTPVEPSPTSADTASTGGPSSPTTPTTPPGPDCTVAPPRGPFVWDEVPLQTEEDFDFDREGYLVTQNGSDLLGLKRDGSAAVVAANIGFDAAGIRSLATGDLVVAQPDTGSLRFVSYETGGTVTVLADLNRPNGVESALDGSVYSSEHVAAGEIRQLIPATGEVVVLATLSWPNNLVLSPDEQTLYVVTSAGPLGRSTVVALDRDASGAWGPEVRVFREWERLLGGITTDACGNVYVVEYGGGLVVRLDAQDASGEVLAELPEAGGAFSSLRFAPGLGEFRRTELFVTDRLRLFVTDLGIEGRHVLAGWPTR